VLGAAGNGDNEAARRGVPADGRRYGDGANDAGRCSSFDLDVQVVTSEWLQSWRRRAGRKLDTEQASLVCDVEDARHGFDQYAIARSAGWYRLRCEIKRQFEPVGRGIEAQLQLHELPRVLTTEQQG